MKSMTTWVWPTPLQTRTQNWKNPQANWLESARYGEAKIQNINMKCTENDYRKIQKFTWLFSFLQMWCWRVNQMGYYNKVDVTAMLMSIPEKDSSIQRMTAQFRTMDFAIHREMCVISLKPITSETRQTVPHICNNIIPCCCTTYLWQYYHSMLFHGLVYCKAYFQQQPDIF